MNYLNGNIEITNEVGDAADANAPIISLFGGEVAEEATELALVA